MSFLVATWGRGRGDVNADDEVGQGQSLEVIANAC
jgi:hypothetical protein